MTKQTSPSIDKNIVRMFFGDDKIFTDDEARRCMARVDGTLAELVCVQSDFLMMS